MAGIKRQQRDVAAATLKQVKFRLDDDTYEKLKNYALEKELSIQMLFEQFVAQTCVNKEEEDVIKK